MLDHHSFAYRALFRDSQGTWVVHSLQPLRWIALQSQRRIALWCLSYALVPMLRNIRSAGAKIRSLEFFQNLPMKS